MRRLSLLTLALSAALVACGGSSDAASSTGPNSSGSNGTGTTDPPANNITLMPDTTFSPASLTVATGSTVTWTWSGCASYTYGPTGCISHSVVFDDGSNISSAIQDSGTFTRTFNTAGTYNYHCGVHGVAMAGKVVVQ